MCGRFAVNQSVKDYLPSLISEWDGPDDYNVAPTEEVRVVRERDGERMLVPARWGLVAPRAPALGAGKPVINARMETVATNGMFRGPFTTHRCIVPALGYYEWQARQNGKQPFFIHEPDAAIAMAGVLRAWRDPVKDEEDPDRWRLTMAIITRDAHVAPGEVHDRMPACLTPDAFDDWLGDRLSPDELLELLDRSSFQVAHQLESYEVSREVSSVRNKGEHNLDPMPAPREQPGLF